MNNLLILIVLVSLGNIFQIVTSRKTNKQDANAVVEVHHKVMNSNKCSSFCACTIVFLDFLSLSAWEGYLGRIHHIK